LAFPGRRFCAQTTCVGILLGFVQNRVCGLYGLRARGAALTGLDARGRSCSRHAPAAGQKKAEQIMRTLPRSIAVFPEIKQVSQYVTACRLIVTMMTGNKNVPNPMPPLSQVSAHLDTLKAAEELAGQGGKGTAPQRDVELSVVRNDMRLLRAYVQ